MLTDDERRAPGYWRGTTLTRLRGVGWESLVTCERSTYLGAASDLAERGATFNDRRASPRSSS
jgi:hypothetical protein